MSALSNHPQKHYIFWALQGRNDKDKGRQGGEKFQEMLCRQQGYMCFGCCRRYQASFHAWAKNCCDPNCSPSDFTAAQPRLHAKLTVVGFRFN